MIVHTSVLKNIELYKSIITKKFDKVSLLETMINDETLSFFNTCFILYNASFYMRMHDASFLEKQRENITKKAYLILKGYLLEQKNEFYDEVGVFTSIVGAAYGALYNVNLVLKDSLIAQEIIGIKSKLYDTNTSGGMLCSKKGSKNISLDILFAIVPFNLFTPEDLVVIEFLEELHTKLETKKGIAFMSGEGESEGAAALLAWYYTEKADYTKALQYIKLVDKKGDYSCVIDIITILMDKKSHLKEPLIHEPYGNSNRYEHQIYEREPWLVKEGKDFYVNCAIDRNRLSENDITLVLKAGDREDCYKPIKVQGERLSFKIIGLKNEKTARYTFLHKGLSISKEYTMNVLSEHTPCDFYIRNSTNGLKAYFSVADDSYELSCKKEAFTHLRIEKIDTYNASKTQKMDAHNFYNRLNKDYSLQVKNINVYSNGFIKVSFLAPKDCGYYGFGQRYNSINQKGNIVDNYVYNQYKNQGIKTYIPMPFFMTNKNFGILLNTACYSEFDLEKTKKGMYSIFLEDSIFDAAIYDGTPHQIYKEYIKKIGKPSMVPSWALGPWMSSNNWDNQKEVEYQLEKTIEYDIPSTVLVIEAWSDEATYYAFNDAQYNENNGDKTLSYEDYSFPTWGRWPNPKAMIEKLHKNDVKCILWQIPILKNMNGLTHIQLENDKKYAVEHDFVVKNEDGSPYTMPEGWFTDSMLFDYTNDEASQWWFNKRNYLIDDLNIDGFKTDGGEFVFGDSVSFSNGQKGKEMRNLYPNLYISKYYDAIKKNDGITFSRAGYTGAGSFPAHWAGDERSTFDAFKRNLCAGITASLSGIVFWGWDLAGFSGEIPSAELYARSTAMACFCPIMQYHAESKAQFNQDRTPWNIAERQNAPWIIDMYRFYAKLRMALMPYIKENALSSIKDDKPLMRALLFDYPEDKNVWNMYDEYLFGDSLLVAPIIEEGKKERLVYLPKGNWKHFFTKEAYEGGTFYTVKASLKEIPVFIKASASIEI